MALNPYTLYHLYEKGILDYVPTDLLTTTQVGAMTSASNPYLDMAMQGGLYQNQGAYTDTFQSQTNSTNSYGVQSPYQQNYQSKRYIETGTVQNGINSNVGGLNIFNGYGVGTKSAVTTAGLFGFNDVSGSKSQAGGLSMFGFGADTKNNISNGFNNVVTVFDRTPKIILGIIGGVIGLAAIKKGFRIGKKPVVKTQSGFMSKFNPKNWFKKNK